MCEVNSDNFEALLPEITSAIEDAAFIAIDFEFTGLHLNNSSPPSFLDSVEQRYGKLKDASSHFTVSQVGLCAFRHIGKSVYVAESFNFYLCPQFFGPLDCRFMFQASAVEFLCNHNFDFNKFIYKGIPFLNKQQEVYLQKCHSKRSIVSECSSIFVSKLDSQFINETCKEIEAWLHNAGSETLEISHPCSGIVEYCCLSALERKFLGKFHYTVLRSGDKVLLTKLKKEEKPSADFLESEYQRILRSQAGFSRVIQLLAEYEKPIVGHNCIADLIFLFDKFYKPLPNDYFSFKRELHKFLPKIYDTKLMSIRLKQIFKDSRFFEDSCLQDLYFTLSSNSAKFHILFSPQIRFGERSKKYETENYPHEAGFDAYTTGYVFLRIAHFIAMKDTSPEDYRPLLPYEYFEELKDFENCVQVAKMTQRYINLSGKDPSPKPIARFYVVARDKKRKLNASEVANQFVVFGTADVAMLSSSEALVAVSVQRKSANIEQAFKKNKNYRVQKYNPLWHSKKSQIVFWFAGASLAILSLTGLGLFIYHRPSS